MAKKKPGTALISMAELEKMYAAEATEAAQAVSVSGMPMISTRDSQFSCNDVDLPEPLNLIVVAEAIVNVYYDSDYVAGENNAPACFAIAPAVKDAKSKMVSHETSPNRQGGEGNRCATCEMNQYGTADRGRGKACSNTRKLAVVMANDPELKKPDGRPQVALLTIPPTGLRAWGKYVTTLDKVVHRPPHGVVTRFGFNKKDPKESMRKAVIPLSYEPISEVNTALSVKRMRDELLADGVLLRPLPVDGYVSPQAKQPVAARGRSAKPAAAATAKAQPKGAAGGKAARF